MRIALALLLAIPALAHADPVQVTASRLNVRSSPWGRVLGQVPNGTKLVARSTSGGWHTVDFGGGQAYISARYTRATRANALNVTASVLNVRTGPSTSNTRIGRVRRGQSYVRLRDNGSGWSQIQFDGRKGWVSNDFVQARPSRGMTNALGGGDSNLSTASDGNTGTNGTSSNGSTNGTSIPLDPASNNTTGNPTGGNPTGGNPVAGNTNTGNLSSANPTNGTTSGTPLAGTDSGNTGVASGRLRSVYKGLTYMGSQIPRQGVYNRILRRADPYGVTTTHRGLQFVLGRISHFGGPTDRGVTASETGTITGERLRSLNNPMRPTRAQTRSRPRDFYYVAMRWDYRPNGRTFWRQAKILVIAPSGRAVVVRPVDWGPHTRTRRILDLSPQAVRDLGLRTDQSAMCAFADPSTPLGPIDLR